MQWAPVHMPFQDWLLQLLPLASLHNAPLGPTLPQILHRWFHLPWLLPLLSILHRSGRPWTLLGSTPSSFPGNSTPFTFPSLPSPLLGQVGSRFPGGRIDPPRANVFSFLFFTLGVKWWPWIQWACGKTCGGRPRGPDGHGNEAKRTPWRRPTRARTAWRSGGGVLRCVEEKKGSNGRDGRRRRAEPRS